jgi:uncharacterized RDD family membrane protein YckC/outer membrane biosynthesis protein TonB
MIWEIDDSTPTIEGVDANGRPDPAYAAALGLLPAPLGRRALAAVLDVAFWMLLQLLLWLGALPLLLKFITGSISSYGFINHPDFVRSVVFAAVTLVLSIVYCIVQLVLHGRKGRTIGKGITGIRTVNVRTLERPKVGPVFMRFLMVGASGILPVVGPALVLISPLFDPERRGRGWHDRATSVWLVDVRAGLQPYDEKRMRVARKIVKAEPTAERSALPSLATPVHPGAQPEYRPGGRVSAGVLGIARPHENNERPTVGLSQPVAHAEVAPVEAGKPVLGGYRTPDTDQNSDAPVRSTPATPFVEVPPSIAPRAGATPVIPPPAPVQHTPAPVLAPAQQPAPVVPPALGVPPVPVPTQAPVHQAPAVQTPAPVQQPAPTQTPDSPVQQPAPTQSPAAAFPAAVAVPTPVAPRFGLRLDTGERITLVEPVLFGRNPDASGFPGARAMALPDDSRSLSKTHLLMRPVVGGIEIMDCHSTNGSGLIRDGVEYTVTAGTPVAATEGDVIRFGDRTAAVVRV